MIVFITSLRHPDTANSYARVESLLDRTLNSVCNQTSRNFRVIVVCNQIPNLSSIPPEVEFVKVDFPPPSHLKGSKVNAVARAKDKGSKYVVGLLHASKYNAEYIMFFDADDLLSNRIVDYVESNSGNSGWYINKGYVYGDGGYLIKPKKQFHKWNGSSHIIRFELFNLPFELLGITPNQDLILKKVDNYLLTYILGNHQKTTEYFSNLGHPLQPLPFPGVVWVLDTGENNTGSGSISWGYPISKSLSKEFSLKLPDKKLYWVISILITLPSSILRILLEKGKKVLN